MKTSFKPSYLLPVIIIIFTTIGASVISDTTFNFDKQKIGNTPEGWTNTSGTWMVKQDGNNKVLAQKAKNRGNKFNVCVFDGDKPQDVDLSVDIRAISGKEDQGGGLVWRFIDAKNYYIVRFNPLEDNYRLYKVYKGRRIQLKSANAHVSQGAWFTVKAVMKNNEITCYLNGEKLINHKDDTFTKAGKTGFWTKADAVSDFDNYKLKGK